MNITAQDLLLMLGSKEAELIKLRAYVQEVEQDNRRLKEKYECPDRSPNPSSATEALS